MSGRNASPPHPSEDAIDSRQGRPERSDVHEKNHRLSRPVSPSPREDVSDFKKPSRRSYSRSRSPERDRDRGGESKGGRNARNISLSPIRDRDRRGYYESDSPSPRNSYRRGGRYRSRSSSRSSRGRSRSRSPVRRRNDRHDRGAPRRHRRRDRKRHRYDSRSRSRSRSPMWNGYGGFDDEESWSSRSPPRRRARYDSRSPDSGRYGRRGEFDRDRGGRRNRDRDRRGRGGGRGPFYDDQATQSLFVSALDSAAERHKPPFNVSIINDRMRQLDRSWDISNSDYKRFADLCHEMHRRGVLEVDRVRETICVIRFLPNRLNGRLNESRGHEDDYRYERSNSNRGPPRDEYRWRRDERGNYTRQLISEEDGDRDRRHPRDRGNKFEGEEYENRSTKDNGNDNYSSNKNGLVNGEEKTNSATDGKKMNKEGGLNGEKEVGSTDMDGVSASPAAEAEKDGSGGENGKKVDDVEDEAGNDNGMNANGDGDAGSTNPESHDKEHSNEMVKKQHTLDVDENERDSVVV